MRRKHSRCCSDIPVWVRLCIGLKWFDQIFGWFFFFIEIWCVTLLEFRWFCVCSNCDYLIFFGAIEMNSLKNENRVREWKKSVIMCKNGANQILEVFVKMIKKLTWNWNCCLSKSVTLYTIGLDSMKSEKAWIMYLHRDFTNRSTCFLLLLFIVYVGWSWFSSVSTPARILLNIHISMYRLILFFGHKYHEFQWQFLSFHINYIYC